jgi:polysaccharide biosynthesis/export protein
VQITETSRRAIANHKDVFRAFRGFSAASERTCRHMKRRAQGRCLPGPLLFASLLLLLLNSSASGFGQGGSKLEAAREERAPQQKDSFGPAATVASDSSTGMNSAYKTPSLLIGAGDLVEMTVYNVPELTTKTRVGSDGDGYFPLIGYVHVAGFTTEEIQSVLEARLSAFVKQPFVSLFVPEYTSQGVSVLGEVMKPGVYSVVAGQRLFEMISRSGGLTERAGQTITVTHRNDAEHPVNIRFSRNLDDRQDTNVEVLPGDTIVVRRADIVYVMGEVAKPSGLRVDAGDLTVLRAIALAGGTTRLAKMSGTKILHKGPNGLVETPVRLSKILHAKSTDLTLQADDILVIPASAGKTLAGRALEAAIQAATLVSVTAVQ